MLLNESCMAFYMEETFHTPSACGMPWKAHTKVCFQPLPHIFPTRFIS